MAEHRVDVQEIVEGESRHPGFLATLGMTTP
jgi:hypothetical protein